MSHLNTGRDAIALSGGDLIEQAGFKVDRVDKIELHLHRDASSNDLLPPKPPAVYLPLKPTNFVGREEYFEKIRAALVPQPGMFLLSGDPGSGKSTAAQMFAWRVQKEFEAVVYQTCGQRSVEVIAGELADTLKEQLGNEITRLPAQDKVRTIRTWLQQRRSLLILDDSWLEETATTELKLQDLLPNPPASVLFTSRRPSLPWISAENRLQIEAFTPEEVEDTFRLYLGPKTVERYREELLQFAERVDRLPIAVAVAAQLLQSEFGPLDEVARQLKLSQLRSQIHDVPGLFQRAIDVQGENERRLLLAASVCVPEGFWLPFPINVAGLDPQIGATARNHLANAGLLKVVDQDKQRFQLHSLLREQLWSSEPVAEFRAAHARLLLVLFKQWETRWQDCRECLKEIFSAVNLLFSTAPESAWNLGVLAGECAYRIGELETNLQIQQQQEKFWEARTDEQSRDHLQVSYGNQALTLFDWGRTEEAFQLQKKKEALCLQLGNKQSLSICYGNQALILNAWQRLEEALELHMKEEAICLELGDKDGLQTSYGNQASILASWGQLDEALALLKKQQATCEDLGNKEGLASSYSNQALILRRQGRFEKASELLKKAEVLCREFGDRLGLAHCNWTWGLLARKMHDEKLATEKLKAALAIFTELKMSLQIEAVKAELNPEQASSASAQ